MPHTHELSAADFPVKSVTIFKAGPRPSGLFSFNSTGSAEVARLLPVKLQAGENIVKIIGLSSEIDTESARVSGLPASVRLFDVLCKIKPPRRLDPDSPEEEIRLLRAKKESLESEKRVRGHEADILLQYGKTLTGEHITPETAGSFLESFLETGKRNIEATAKIDQELLEIDREIDRILERKTEKAGQARAEVVVTLAAREEASFELKLTYLVRNASWTANYDLHATTESGQPKASVNLHYRAKIVQSTGEDWKDASLTLSTATSNNYLKGLPALKVLRVSPAEPHYRPGFRPNAGGLFGNTNNFMQKSGPPFGQSSIAFAQQVQASAGGLFGQALQQEPTAGPFQQEPTAGLFQQQPTIGGFGSQTGPTTSLFGGGPPPPPPAPLAARGPFPAQGAAFGSNVPYAAHSAPAFSSDVPYAATYSAAADGAGLPGDGEDDEFEEIADFTAGDAVAGDHDGGDANVSNEPRTVVHESALSTSFRVEGKTSVPSDGLPHQVLVSVLPFEATLSYVTVPRAEAAAYVQCKVENTSEYRLLPGSVSVFLDESFVSKTLIQDINTGDTFECTLGTDPLIGVTYARTVRAGKVEGGAFSEKTRTVFYTVTTTVKNRHRFALPELVVRNTVPLTGPPGGSDETAEDRGSVDRLRVILRAPAGLVDAKEGEKVKTTATGAEDVVVRWAPKGADGKGGEKEGKFEWLAKVESGAAVELKLEYEIKGPADAKWVLRTSDV